jgi:hypothetical protein
LILRDISKGDEDVLWSFRASERTNNGDDVLSAEMAGNLRLTPRQIFSTIL